MELETASPERSLLVCRCRFKVLKAILVRFVLLAHSCLVVFAVAYLRKEKSLYILLTTNIFLVLETAYTVIKRKGQESRWFCPCFLAYTCAVVPPILLIELYRMEQFDGSNWGNAQLTADRGLDSNIRLLVQVVEQTVLLVLILSRWALPRGDITRHELSQLLFVFLGRSSDIMQLFELFDLNEVRSDRTLSYITLGVWSISLLQLSFVLTATKNISKNRVFQTPSADVNSSGRIKVTTTTPNSKAPLNEKPSTASHFAVIFTTEIWALILGMVLQDGPFAVIRLHVMVRHNVMTYSIIYFVCKNLLVILLVAYRLTAVCLHEMERGSGHETEVGQDDPFGNKGKDDDRRNEAGPTPLLLAATGTIHSTGGHGLTHNGVQMNTDACGSSRPRKGW